MHAFLFAGNPPTLVNLESPSPGLAEAGIFIQKRGISGFPRAKTCR
jgi:hypothetical protein